MRTGRELILATLPYAKENKVKSWYHVISTILYVLAGFGVSVIVEPVWLKLFVGVINGLLLVRFFILYHDYNHYAILRNSKVGKIVMTLFGLFILAPITIWKRSHDYHHNNNSKLSNNGVGSYPLLSRTAFNKLNGKARSLYLIARHPLTIFLGYISLFIFDFNIKTFIQSPKRHWDSIIALIFHFFMYWYLYTNYGLITTILVWTIPFLVSNGVGAYLFYAQHNFPGAMYVKNKDWEYTQAALKSTSFFKMNSIMNWFTGDIGYHHVHHLNHHIPFYRLREAQEAIPELQSPLVTSFNPKDIIACLRLKVWDEEKGEMAPL